MLSQSITFTLSFFSKAVVVLELCWGLLSCWNTANWNTQFPKREDYALPLIMLSVISRGCLWKIDIGVLPALLQRLKGRGVSLSVLTPYTAHCIKLVCMAVVPRQKPSSKIFFWKWLHKKARKQFAEDKQTMDMNYWSHVLWSDETKVKLFGSDGVKCVWQQPGEE